jgi:hypothetical protein
MEKVHLSLLHDIKLLATTPRERHVIMACSKDSGAWLDTLPNMWNNAVMSTTEWRVAVWFRLGLPIYSSSVVCPCCKESPNDIYGIHATYCANNNDLKARHDHVRDTIAAIAREAQFSVEVESRHLLAGGGVRAEENWKPADIFIRNWEMGKGLCLDVSIANSLEYTHENRDFDPLEALWARENAKYAKYSQMCSERGLLFEPFVTGSLGGFTEVGTAIVKKIGRAWSNVQGVSSGVGTATIRKRILYAVQVAQATSWIRRGVLSDNMRY